MSKRIFNIIFIFLLVTAVIFVISFVIYNISSNILLKKIDTSKYDTLINNLEKDKLEIIRNIDEKSENVNLIYEQIRLKDKEIQNKNREISKLKEKINEKVDSVGNLDNKHTYELLSEWVSKDN